MKILNFRETGGTTANILEEAQVKFQEARALSQVHITFKHGNECGSCQLLEASMTIQLRKRTLQSRRTAEYLRVLTSESDRPRSKFLLYTSYELCFWESYLISLNYL